MTSHEHLCPECGMVWQHAVFDCDYGAAYRLQCPEEAHNTRSAVAADSDSLIAAAKSQSWKWWLSLGAFLAGIALLVLSIVLRLVYPEQVSPKGSDGWLVVGSALTLIGGVGLHRTSGPNVKRLLDLGMLLAGVSMAVLGLVLSVVFLIRGLHDTAIAEKGFVLLFVGVILAFLGKVGLYEASPSGRARSK